MSKIRYGILSTAGIVKDAHIPAARASSNSEVVAIASRDGAHARCVASELGIERSYGSYEELLNDPQVDVVLNALPPSLHSEWTIRAASAGKHVLCEKPFALTRMEAQAAVDAAKRHGVLILEGFTHRFRPEATLLRDIVASKEIGEIHSIYAELVYPLGDGWTGHTRARKELGGGALNDCGCYCISLIRYVMGQEPIAVQGIGSLRQPNNVYGTFTGSMLFAEGTQAMFLASMELPFRCELEIQAERGSARLDNFFTGNKVTYSVDGNHIEKTFTPTDRFALQMEHFSDCVRRGNAPRFTPEDAVSNAEVLEALDLAARKGTRISL